MIERPGTCFAATALAAAVLILPPLAHSQAIVDGVRLVADRNDPEAMVVPVNFRLELAEASRGADSWDALWVFAKFRAPEGDWRDVRWAPDGHQAASVGPTDVSAEVVPATGGPFIGGVFVQRAATGRSAAAWDVELVWSYETSQIELPPDGLPIRVYAVEMVRIPEGAFEVGAPRGDGITSSFFASDGVGGDEGPFRIESESAILVGDSSGALLYEAGDYGGDRAGPIPDAFPKGYAAFYIMKRELTDGEYAAFLATIGPRARASRNITLSSGYAESGGSIAVRGDSVTVTAPDRAGNFIAWADGTAWAAWAGLRPMTELEFEKVASGPASYEVEDILDGRWERVVTVGWPEGRRYTGSHGWGFVDSLGQPYAFANGDWPGPLAVGSGFRGGFEGGGDLSSSADRTYAGYDATYGDANEGFRAVRTAPR